jgi:ATP-binding cassette subfamily B protein
MPKFPHYLQPDALDCGPTCLRIVAKYFGKHYNLETLRELTWELMLFGIRSSLNIPKNTKR